MINPAIKEAFASLEARKCENKVGSIIIQSLQRAMHRDRVLKAKGNRGVKNVK